MSAIDGGTFRPANGPLLHVSDSGGAGRPVLFQHGLCGDAAQTAEILPPSPAYRRLTLECRGHGQSAAGNPAAFSIATFADDCMQFLAATTAEPVVVAGISMGAAIALRIAVVMPQRVRALVLARPAWLLAAAPANMAPNAEVGALLQAFPPEEAKARFLRGNTAQRLAVEAPDNLASLLGFFTRPDPQTTAQLLTAISADGPGVTRKQVSQIAVPTLVIGNAQDAVHPLPLAEKLAGLIPGATCIEITAKAKDRPRHVAEFRHHLQSFLKGLEP